MEEALIILLRGAGVGAVYALIAMALNVIYNATGVLNFAQGQLTIVAAVLTYLWIPVQLEGGTPLWLTIDLAIAVSITLIAIVQGMVTLLPMRSQSDQHSWVITTLAASIIIGQLVILTLGPRTLSVPDPFGRVSLLGVNVPIAYLALMGLALTVYFVLKWIQRRFLVGLALSALSQDLEAAKTNGVATFRTQVLSFAIGGAIVALTGLFGGSVIEVSPEQALSYTTFGFIAAVVGGLGNNTGALIAGPVLGVLLMLIIYTVGGGAQLPIALGALVLVLVARPQGILGRVHARRV